MAIYSHCVNSGKADRGRAGRGTSPGAATTPPSSSGLFRGYVDRKEQAGVLDYDDLLLFWHGLLAEPTAGERVRSGSIACWSTSTRTPTACRRRSCRLLRPDGAGLTAVGDDAQSIYSFRAATVRNILDFPQTFPGTTVVKLEQNYRSTQPILAATNAVIAAGQGAVRQGAVVGAAARATSRRSVTCEDERRAGRVRRSAGARAARGRHRPAQAGRAVPRRRTTASCWKPSSRGATSRSSSIGGLKFIEAAHVKDLMAFLRLAENPRDVVAGIARADAPAGHRPARRPGS